MEGGGEEKRGHLPKNRFSLLLLYSPPSLSNLPSFLEADITIGHVAQRIHVNRRFFDRRGRGRGAKARSRLPMRWDQAGIPCAMSPPMMGLRNKMGK